MIRQHITKPRAETIALESLAFLAEDEAQLDRFLVVSGVTSGELRDRASDPDMLRAVLEYVLTDDRLVTGFCQRGGLTPQDLHMANHLLGEA